MKGYPILDMLAVYVVTTLVYFNAKRISTDNEFNHESALVESSFWASVINILLVVSHLGMTRR